MTLWICRPVGLRIFIALLTAPRRFFLFGAVVDVLLRPLGNDSATTDCATSILSAAAIASFMRDFWVNFLYHGFCLIFSEANLKFIDTSTFFYFSDHFPQLTRLIVVVVDFLFILVAAQQLASCG